MLKLKKIAVTGGLACGKSTVCRFFKELGAYVVSADEVVHKLLSPETTLGKQVINLMGSDIVDNHQINRQKVANKVFQNNKLLKALEEILHPAVMFELHHQFQSALQDEKITLFVAEVPLLFEAEFESFFDVTVAVAAKQELCIKRFEKVGYDKNAFESRAARQLSIAEKSSRADYVIENNGTETELQENVKGLFKELKK